MELLFELFSGLAERAPEKAVTSTLDLPPKTAEQPYQYVYQRYGELGSAMTANGSPIAEFGRS